MLSKLQDHLHGPEKQHHRGTDGVKTREMTVHAYNTICTALSRFSSKFDQADATDRERGDREREREKKADLYSLDFFFLLNLTHEVRETHLH